MDYCRLLEIAETDQWILLKEMVAYDEPCVVPIKRTLQKIDYQNQAYKELEVRPESSYTQDSPSSVLLD